MRCQLSKEVNYILTFLICPYTHTLAKVIQTLVRVLEEPSMGPLSSRVMAHWTRLCPMTKEFWSRGSASIHSATTSGGLRCSGVGPTPLEVSRERITNPSISTNWSPWQNLVLGLDIVYSECCFYFLFLVRLSKYSITKKLILYVDF